MPKRRPQNRAELGLRGPSLRDYLLTIAVSAAASPPQTFFYGGQAVIEGVLMRGPRHYAVAARNPQGEIVITSDVLRSRVYTSNVWKQPFLRGIAGLAEMLHLGTRALQWSANIQLGETVQLSARAIRATMAFSVVFALALFVGGPALIAHLFHPNQPWFGSAQHSVSTQTVLIEGVARAGILVAYLLLIGQFKTIGRLFAYHGAEHKAINCYESGDTLDVDHVRAASRLHPRCGTGFLLVVAFLSVLVFIPLAVFPIVVRLGLQVLLVPVVAAISYEAIRALAKIRHTTIGRILLAPVLATQLLSTREPDDSQMQVSLAALQKVRSLQDSSVGEAHDPTLI